MKYTFKNRGCKPPVAKLEGAGAVLGKINVDDLLNIRVAGNEQKPLDFSNSEYVKTEHGPIKTFDYALCQDQDNYAIERKSLGDFVSSVSLHKNWIHELAKITRAREWELPIIYVLEFGFDDIAKYDYSVFTQGKITSQFIYRRVAEIIFGYNVHVVFAGSREGAVYAICLLLKRRKESLRLKGK